ncbi:MAG TPA: DNA-formamidopyrimidine glycosylase family protein [Candidatus Limnocylindrales bacterium]|nr:DNA-formamidopyrimidine glycosylase family protein [Candidatus Limnocylindrales bacterium]
MPELPDLTVVSEALGAALAGRGIASAVVTAPLAVRGTPDELAALVGQTVTRVGRRGKFLLIEISGDRVVVNPMLSGRFQLAGPDQPRPPATALVLGFGRRDGRQRVDDARWTNRASWLPADDVTVEVRFRDPTQMGKVYLLPAGIDRKVPGMSDGDLGPDADSAELTLDVWRDRIRLHRGELKNLLRDQGFVAGIGNAYSDEILHAARLLPSRRRSSLAAEEIDELYRAMRTVVSEAQAILRQRVPPTFEKQVRDFLAVHGHGGSPCPRCGTRISEIKGGGHVTNFCRGCQR